jgi:hypothetical protein
MPPGVDRLVVLPPALAVRGLHVVVRPYNPQEALSSAKLASLTMPSKPFIDDR